MVACNSLKTGLAGFLVLTALACSSTSTGNKTRVGAEGGPCTAGGGCDPGLVCLAPLCAKQADSGAGGAGESTGVAGGTGGGGAGSGGNSVPASLAAGGRADSGIAGALANDGSIGADGSSTCGTQTLIEGTATLIDVFVVDAGIIVVDSAGVYLIGRDAQVLKSVPFARALSAAAFDGTNLVVADAAEITVMTAGLDIGATATLTESCASAVLLGNHRFICGPSNDWDRVFYTYDVGVNPPKQIATSSKYTYNGIPMRRVPGTDAFVTVTLDLDPPSFYLFRVAADTGQAALAGGSPFDSYAANSVFAFDGSPATQMIQCSGDILGITGSGCNTSQAVSESCFSQSGVLGTLATDQSYIGLGEYGVGRLVAFVASFNNYDPFSSPCADGCPVQLIDIASRSVLLQKTHTITDLGTVVRTTLDTVCGTAILGYGKLDPNQPFDTLGYRVQSFGF
jgi:hypothetical protein